VPELNKTELKRLHLGNIKIKMKIERKRNERIIYKRKRVGKDLKNNYHNAESKRHELESRGFWRYCKAFVC
jgi:hypothetical protein